MRQYSQLEMHAWSCHRPADATSHSLMHRHSCSVSHHRTASKRRRMQPVRSQLAEPNWDEEMTLFRKRVNSPNQLETLRKIEAEVSVGKVLYTGNGVAIVEGLNNDAPIGTKLGFVGGAAGVLLWRRSDNICYALLLGGQPEKGEAVACQINAILQIVDEQDGPLTKRDYEITMVPVGDSLVGKCTDFLGRPLGSSMQAGQGPRLPLFNEQVAVEDREQILEAMLTGVKAVDVLTPIGRGQAQLITGLPGSGKTSLVLDAILGQRATGVRCIYTAPSQAPQEVGRTVEFLRAKGALKYTSVVAAPADAPISKRYAALCSACSQGEHIRDGGGHALVVLDDISCMVEMWEHITQALAELGPAALATEEGAPGEEPEDPDQLVSYEGMLVSVAAAQRRRFFSMLVQRSAKMHRRKGGGSLTLLLVLAGRPATGQARRKPDVSKYRHLSPELKAKLEAALESQSELLRPSTSGARTEVVEEFMSIADGQTVMMRERDRQPGPVVAAGELPSTSELRPGTPDAATGTPRQASGAVRVDATSSMSRIGGRAYPPALRELAQTTRLDLVQALDAARFYSDKADPAFVKAQQRAERLTAALAQPPGRPVPLEEQVAILLVLQSDLLRNITPRHIPLWLSIYVQSLWDAHPQIMRDIAESLSLPPEGQELLKSALAEAFSQYGSPV